MQFSRGVSLTAAVRHRQEICCDVRDHVHAAKFVKKQFSSFQHLRTSIVGNSAGPDQLFLPMPADLDLQCFLNGM